MAREQRLVPIIGTAHTDTETSPHFKLTPKGRAAIDDLDEQLVDCADENSEAAREAAVFGNFDTVAHQQTLIRELTAQVDLARIAIEGLTEQRDGALAQNAELLAEQLRLTERLHATAVCVQEALDRVRPHTLEFAGRVPSPDAFLFNDLCSVRRTLAVALLNSGVSI